MKYLNKQELFFKLKGFIEPREFYQNFKPITINNIKGFFGNAQKKIMEILLITFFTPITLFAQMFSPGDVLIGIAEENPQTITIVKSKLKCENKMAKVLTKVMKDIPYDCYEVLGLKNPNGSVADPFPRVDFIDKYYLKKEDYELFDIANLNIKQNQVYTVNDKAADILMVYVIGNIEMKMFGKSKLAVPAYSNLVYGKEMSLLADIYDIVNNRPLSTKKKDFFDLVFRGTVSSENKPDSFSGIWKLSNISKTVKTQIIFLEEGEYLVPKGGIFSSNNKLEQGKFIFDSEKSKLYFYDNSVWRSAIKSEKVDDLGWTLKKISDRKFQSGEVILEKMY